MGNPTLVAVAVSIEAFVMHRFLQITGAFALAALCPLSSHADDGSSDAVLQDCDTMSAEEYCVIQVGSQVTSQFGPQSAWLDAINNVMDLLVTNSGVVCGPCDIPDACRARAYLQNSLQTLGPTQIGTTHAWVCRAWYEGCYEIECGECDA